MPKKIQCQQNCEKIQKRSLPSAQRGEALEERGGKDSREESFLLPFFGAWMLVVWAGVEVLFSPPFPAVGIACPPPRRGGGRREGIHPCQTASLPRSPPETHSGGRGGGGGDFLSPFVAPSFPPTAPPRPLTKVQAADRPTHRAEDRETDPCFPPRPSACKHTQGTSLLLPRQLCLASAPPFPLIPLTHSPLA